MLPVFVLDDSGPGAWRLGDASRWWLHGSLASLAAGLERLGAPLVLRRGPAIEVIPALLRETGANRVHAGRMHEPWGAEAERTLLAAGVPLHLHRTATLSKLDVRSKTGGVYGVYTPFARAMRARGAPPEPLPPPRRIQAPAPPRSDPLESWRLLPTTPDWAGGLRETWTPGEAGAQHRLCGFVDRAMRAYATGRNLPGEDGTSMLSPHLHWGEISPAQVWHAASRAAGGREGGVDTWLGELLWREFSAYLLRHNPALPEQPLRRAFSALPFRDDPDGLHAWQRGQTGIPIVDAGMRQLWRIGWMHNRVRMIAASFLVKHLLIDWRHGERWFWDTLVDADLATNAASWQWVAGTGIDSQPFFRVFNPVSQGKQWDAAGAYVRRWVPELARLPDRFLHAPWTAPAKVLAAAGVALGRTYPDPLIDLAEGRRRALDTYRATVKTPVQQAA